MAGGRGDKITYFSLHILSNLLNFVHMQPLPFFFLLKQNGSKQKVGVHSEALQIEPQLYFLLAKIKQHKMKSLRFFCFIFSCPFPCLTFICLSESIFLSLFGKLT